MIKLLLHSWLFSSHSLAGVSQQQSVLNRMLQFLKKKYRGLNMKYKTLKFLRRRKIARRKFQTTEKGVQVLIIILVLAVLLLAGCSYRMVPNETKIEYGTTETDAKNSKLQEKKFITQTWKWK
tara:strand:+ start:114 stop:482 length:369 start_codon:yes stop_codon:yes gene_type:complete